MPKTPPLIIPNSIPTNDWINRSRINKGGSKVKNIFAAQQTKKQLRFDETEELQFPETSHNPPPTDIDFKLQSENPPSSPQATSDVFFFTPLNQQQQPSQANSHKHSQQNGDQSKSSQRSYIQTKNAEPSTSKMDIEHQSQEQQHIALQNSKNFNSILTG
jgi:hypothetical protein